MTTPPQPNDELDKAMTVHRERLGKRVREVWIAWAKQQPNPKSSWLVEWDNLSEPDKEVDRRIGCVIWGDCVAEHAEVIANHILAAKRSKELVNEVEMLRECNAQLVASEQSIRTECNRLRRETGALDRKVSELEGRIANALI